MVSAVPYLLLGEARSHRLREHVAECLSTWQQHWFGQVALFESLAAQSLDAWPGALRIVFDTARHRPVLQIGATTELIPRLLGLQAMSASAGAVAMSAQLALSLQLEMLQQLGAALLQSACIQAAPRDAAADAPVVAPADARCWWQATFTLSHSFERLMVRVHPEVIAGLVPRAVAVVGLPATRRAAVESETVRVDAWLGEVRLTLREFTTLQTGDVLLLDDARPAYLTAHDRHCVGAIQLGRNRQRRAVRISSIQPRVAVPTTQGHYKGV